MSRKAPKTKWGIDIPRTEKGMQFIAIGKSLYDCDAYKTLPSGAKILLQELMRLCYPNNNGRVGMSQQRAAEFAGVTKKTAGSYLNLLAERGFIVIAKYRCHENIGNIGIANIGKYREISAGITNYRRILSHYIGKYRHRGNSWPENIGIADIVHTECRIPSPF